MKGHLTTATEGNIRGRLVVNFEGELAVGSSVNLMKFIDIRLVFWGKCDIMKPTTV